MTKKQRTVERQLSFAHAVKAVNKMAIVKKSFPSDKLSSDDFDSVQVQILKRTNMTAFEDHMGQDS